MVMRSKTMTADVAASAVGGLVPPSTLNPYLYSTQNSSFGQDAGTVQCLARVLSGDTDVDLSQLQARCPGLILGEDEIANMQAVKAYILADTTLLNAVLAVDPLAPASQAPPGSASGEDWTSADVNSPRRWSAADLLTVEFPPLAWVVPDLLPAGLIILAGRPKLGKSFLALQIAQAVGIGSTVLGQTARHGAVLYLAHEDGPRRLQGRARAQGWSPEAQVDFYTTWPDLLDGGLARLEEAIVAEEYVLVIVATVSRAVTFRQNDVEDSTWVFSQLQKLAMHHDCAILLIDHHRKGSGFTADPVDDLLGSTGKSAVPDAIWGLFRQRGQAIAVLKITGRDLEDQELALSWTPDSCTWDLLGDAQDVTRSQMQQEVLAALEALGGEATTKDLALHIERNRAQVSRVLGQLVLEGVVKRGPRRGREVPYQLSELAEEQDDADLADFSA